MEAGSGDITCLIVDDHEVVREGLRLSLSRAPHIRVIGEASDGASAVALAERRRPDVVIMDVRMPGMDGLQATKLLTEKVPTAAVLIFTAYSERSLLGRGLESGAKGYILKEAPHQTLVRAIEKVAAGDGYVDPALMPAFLTGKDRDEMLTGREREILQLLADGMSNADVAAEALHQPGDGEEPRPPHPREARGGHPHARGRDCASRSDHRLEPRCSPPSWAACGCPRAGSPSTSGALLGVGLVITALSAGALALHLIASERRRHERIQETLASQASFLESLVESMSAIAVDERARARSSS